LGLFRRRSDCPHNPHHAALADKLLSPTIACRGLVHVRWHGIFGALFIMALAEGLAGVSLPLRELFVCVGLVAISNVFLSLAPLGTERQVKIAIRAALLFDVIMLTFELCVSNSAASPLAAAYVVQMMLAAVMLEARWAAVVVLTGIVGYGILLARTPQPPGVPPNAWMLAFGVHTFVITLTSALTVRLVAAFRQLAISAADAHDAAERAERVAALTTLAAGAAHELATPLGSIAVAATELCALTEHEDSDARVEARVIRGQVERCREILSRLHATTGHSMGEQARATTPDEIVEAVRHRLGTQGADLHADKTHTTPDTRLFVPFGGLVSVLVSLVTNALQASGPGKTVRLVVETSGRRVFFIVKDEGTGMAPHVVERLGEPFLSTKPAGEGMGLGLFLARTFAEACSGALTLRETGPTGTTLCVELPRDVMRRFPPEELGYS
jgi:two-component system, sensor histidine kinase RegB